jgi:hypothetical protein
MLRDNAGGRPPRRIHTVYARHDDAEVAGDFVGVHIFKGSVRKNVGGRPGPWPGRRGAERRPDPARTAVW